MEVRDKPRISTASANRTNKSLKEHGQEMETERDRAREGGRKGGMVVKKTHPFFKS